MLRQEIARHTGDVIEFKNGSLLEISTNDARLVRGRSAIAVLGSEACHWRTAEHAASSDEEVVGAAEPSMAMCPDGGLLLLGSSVHREVGDMYRKYRQLHGNDDSDDSICWFAPSAVMNPKLPPGVIDKALAEDSSKARAEFLNIWREDLSDFIPLDAIEACTDFAVHERAPMPNVTYVAYCDAAGGTGTDLFTLAIAHRGNPHMLDVVRERKPRFVPAQVIAEYAEILKAYRVTKIRGDKYAIGFHADEWRNHGIEFIPCENTTSENYLSLLPLLLSGRVRLLDSMTLRGQLSSLERRVSSADRESVSHPQVASAHDDLATAAAGALVAAAARVEYSLYSGWLDDDQDNHDAWQATRLAAYISSGGRVVL